MKTTILLILTAMSLQSLSQTRFSKRKYTKGIFIETTHSPGSKPERIKETCDTVPYKKESRVPLCRTTRYGDRTDLSPTEDKALTANTSDISSHRIAKHDTCNEWVGPGIRRVSHPIPHVTKSIKKTFSLQEVVEYNRLAHDKSDQNKNIITICSNETQKRTQRFWSEFFNRKNLRYLRFKEYSLQGIGLGLIEYYQNYMSSKKGFGCAYRIYAHGDSCSEYGKRAISDYGIFIGSVTTLVRLDSCAEISSGFNHRKGCRFYDYDCRNLFFIGWGH